MQSTIKLCILLTTLVALVQGAPVKDRWDQEFEAMLNELVKVFTDRMAHLEDIMVKVGEELEELNSVEQINSIKAVGIKDTIHKEMAEANEVALFVRTSLNYYKDHESSRPESKDLALKLKLEPLRAQMVMLDQKLSALNVRVQGIVI